MNLLGLIFDLVGVILIGVSASTASVNLETGYHEINRVLPQWGGHAGFGDQLAKWLLRIGWVVLVLGLTFQLVAALPDLVAGG